MSYTALYRKYRPDSFEEVKGQDHIVVTLRNQITAGRIGHAYLFTGTRGTGKTSVAKIFARAVNCEHPVNGSPCNTCEYCREILRGSSLNVVEIDAASNNGVDDVRRIREEVAYSPSRGKYKVYIIDEAHMLTPPAFNALLKTLEEPPAYVIFILATTEVHKIPVTIISRCQRYDFHRISQAEITRRLADLLEKEGVAAEENALRCIARKAEGGMRDALSLTDQCISFYLGQTLTYDRVLDLLGAVDTEVLGAFYRDICRGDVASVLSRLDRMVFSGRNLTQITTDLAEYLRDLVVLKSTDEGEAVLDVSEENRKRMEEEASSLDEDMLMRHIRILCELETPLRNAVNRRVMLEIALIRMCRPQMETDVTSLSRRIRALEQMIEQGNLPAGPGGGMRRAPAGNSAERGAGEAAAAPVPRYEKAAPKELQRLKQEWGTFPWGRFEAPFQRVVKNARLSYDVSGGDTDTIYLVSDDIAGASARLVDKGQIAQLEDMIEDMLKKRIRVRVTHPENNPAAGPKLREVAVEENLRHFVNGEIETEEQE